MAGETKHETKEFPLECSQFEALLSEALDGQLTPATKGRFDAHLRSCPLCGPLFADAQAGRQWLRSVEEVEPPLNLVHNILAATTGMESARVPAVVSARPGMANRLREWWDSFLAPAVAFIRQPRFVMSFGMIFFTFSLGLSAAGVKPADLAKVDVRPSALKRAYYTTEGKVVKFYDNIRFVYEIESRVREFKRETRPAEPAPPEEQKQNHKNNTSGQPDEKQERNYSRGENQPVLAESRVSSCESRVTSCGLLAASYEPAQNWSVEFDARTERLATRDSKLATRRGLPAVVTTTRRFV